MNVSVRHFTDLLASHNIHILKDTSPKHFRSVAYITCLDHAFASSTTLLRVI